MVISTGRTGRPAALPRSQNVSSPSSSLSSFGVIVITAVPERWFAGTLTDALPDQV